MVARIPLIVNSSVNQIQELPAGDTLEGLSAVAVPADGTIAANAAVTLTSAGKAKTISAEVESHGALGTFHTATGSQQVKAINDIHWDTSQNAAIINWTDHLDARKITVGTLSGSTMTWASPVNQTFGSNYTPSIATDGEGGGVIIWKQSDNVGDAYGGNLLYQTFTLSGSTMTLGNIDQTLSPYNFNTNDAQDRFYVEYLEKVGSSHYYAFAYRWGSTSANGQKAQMRIMKWDGQNNVTLGTEVAYEGTVATTNNDRAAIDPRLIALENSRYLLYDRGNYKVCTRVGTDFRISNTANTLLGATAPTGKAPEYDPLTKTLLTVNHGVSPAGIAVYSINGENITYRFQVDLPTGVPDGHVRMTDKGQIIYSFFDGNTGENAKWLLGTFNEARDHVTWGTATVWTSNANNMGGQPRIVKADDGKLIQVFYLGASGSESGKSIVSQTPTTTLTKDNFLGFSSYAYTDGASAAILIAGGVATKSGLTPGKKYYIQDDGTVGTSTGSFGVVAGKALSATQLLITEV